MALGSESVGETLAAGPAHSRSTHKGDSMSEHSSPHDLSHPRQGVVLSCLDEHVTLSLDDLAVSVLARERDTDVCDLGPEEVRTVRQRLARVHVPELEERSYVRYDESREVVSLLGHGPDARVDCESDPECTVELTGSGPDGVEVELSEETLECIHEAMRSEDRLHPRMSYDEVVRTLLEGGGS
jgi:hypothetical protein